MALELTSRAFHHEHEIPPRYTADGWNISPPLEWSGVPAETREFALTCEDPDAPEPAPFVHWLIYGISANISELPEGLPRDGEIHFPVMARQGRGTGWTLGYSGPNPPFWHGAHRYFFRLFALDAPLALGPGANCEELFKAIDHHLIEHTELLGVYEKSVGAKTRRAAGVVMALSAPVAIYAAVKRFRRSA